MSSDADPPRSGDGPPARGGAKDGPMPIDANALADSLRLLHDQVEHEPGAALQQVVDAARSVFGVSGAGLMMLDAEGALRYVTATSEAARALEQAQIELGYGPCVESVVRNRVIASVDLHDEPAWPGLGERLGPRVRAILGVPVRLHRAPVGSLNVYLDRPQEWADADRRAILAYAELVEQVLSAAVTADRHSRLSDQLQYALDNRVVIERAIGFLMAKLSVDEVAAFEALRRMARNSRRKTVDVAAEVLAPR